MLNTETSLNPKVIKTLELWHEVVATKDMTILLGLLHPDAVFRSPMAFKGYESAVAVVLVISNVVEIFDDFVYHRVFAGSDGLSAVLEFSAKVGDKSVKGIDMIQFDEDGLITDFEVMVRPYNGLQALGAAMGERLGHLLPSYKA